MSVDDSFAQSIVHMYDDSSFSFVHHADGVIKNLGNGEIGFFANSKEECNSVL